LYSGRPVVPSKILCGIAEVPAAFDLDRSNVLRTDELVSD
jgi:hypothetical protein